ncbi:MAG: GldG family protein [Planctomycetes bacterium]|nr:GldG family protein [Planctomycetota bacterium]
MAHRRHRRATPWETTTRLFIVAGLATLLTGGILWLIYDEWNKPVIATLLTGGVVTLFCSAWNAAWLADVVFQKKALFNLNLLLVVVLSGAILVGVNYYSRRHYRRLDTTHLSRYSLSPQTLNLLRNLDQKVEVYAFFNENASVYQDFPFVKVARDLLEEYQATSGKLALEYVDPMKDPKAGKKLLKDLDVKRLEHNSVIFACGERPSLRTKVVTSYDMVHTDYSRSGPGDDGGRKKFKGEDAFTSAIQAVLDERPTVVYFLTGHGERQTDRSQPEEYADLSKELKKANLKVESLQLFEKGKVPEDCSVLVIAGPRSAIPEKELKAIREYLSRSASRRGGQELPPPSLLVLLEPITPTKSRRSQLGPLLKEHHVKVDENVRLVDVMTRAFLTPEGIQAKQQLGLSCLVEDYPDHEITRELVGYPSQFMTLTPVQAEGPAAGPDAEVVVILQGSSKGWGETDTRRLYEEGTAEFDESKDVPPPVNFGVAVKARGEAGLRLVAIGDADFCSNQQIDGRGNLGLALNSILWLGRKTTRLGLPPIDPSSEKFQLTRKGEKIVEFATLYGLPAAWMLFAFGIWIARTITSTAAGRLALALRFGILLGLLFLGTSALLYSKGFETAWVTVPAVLGLALVLVGVTVNTAWMREVIRKRQTLYGANLFVAALLAFFIVGMVNYLATRHYYRSDLTEKKFFALSDITIQELKKVDRKVQATVLLPGSMHWSIEHIENMLDEFRHHSSRIGVQKIFASEDNQEQIELLQEQLNTKLTVEDLPSTIFLSRENVRHVPVTAVVKYDEPFNPMMSFQKPPPPKLVGEQAFLEAILAVSSDRKLTLYFSTGNGERNPESFEDEDFGELAKLLKRANYAVKTLNLDQADSVPSDCSILVLAAPKRPYSEKGLRILRELLAGEGSLLVMAEPEATTGVNSGLSSLLQEYSVRLDERSLIIDRNPFMGYTPMVATADYGYHKTTEELKGSLVQFAMACQVEAVEDPYGGGSGNPYGGPPGGPGKKWNTSWLVKSSDGGWIDRNTGFGSDRVEFDEGMDTKGKATLAVAVEPNNAPPSPYGPPPDPKEKRRGPNLVVFGDADFASNRLVREAPGNEKLILEAVRWLGKETSQDLKISPKEIDLRTIHVEPDSKIVQGAFYLSIFGLPGLLLMPALVVWVLRRR